MTLKDSETDASVRPDDAGADGALSVDPHGDAAEGDDAHLTRALDLASASATTDGGPFGAVVVAADGRVFEGTNRVTAANDPTAHAEVTAIREAAAGLGTFDLSGCVLYSSCEPCPMCLGAALWARIDRVVFAADRHDAAAAGFDDAAFYEYFEAPDRRDAMPVRQHPIAQRTAPFEAWLANGARTAY